MTCSPEVGGKLAPKVGAEIWTVMCHQLNALLALSLYHSLSHNLDLYIKLVRNVIFTNFITGCRSPIHHPDVKPNPARRLGKWSLKVKKRTRGAKGPLPNDGISTGYCATISDTTASHPVVDDEVTGGEGLTKVATEPARVNSRGPSPARPRAGAGI